MRALTLHGKHQHGFTLIELLVALLATSVITTAFLSFFSLQMRTMRVENSRRSAQVTGRAALNFIARNLEQLGRNPRLTQFTSADPALSEAEADSLTYRTNLRDEWTDTDITEIGRAQV